MDTGRTLNLSTDSTTDIAPGLRMPAAAPRSGSLYTPEQRRRRDASRWTVWQGVLAPLQLLACLVSIALVSRWLATGAGGELATASVLLKTALLIIIMWTGCLWEHDVYGKYLFAPAFFWEDMVSMFVISAHVLYLFLWLTGAALTLQFQVALVAYSLYLVNAAQFLLKLRAARRSAALEDASAA